MPRVCVHLEAQSADWDYGQYFGGVGTDYALVCPACRRDPEAVEAKLATVPPDRFAEIEEGGCWDCGKDAILGRPRVRERPTGLGFEHREVALAGDRPGGVADVRPVPTSGEGECLVLADSGDVFRIDPARGTIRRLLNAPEVGMPPSPKMSLQVSPGGRMAAVVEARGRHGIVLDLGSGRPTMRLDRGDYHNEQTDFPAAFFVADGRLLLVHGTAWNRLDVSDPETGELMTARSPTSYRTGEMRPEHYLDYFHGGLAVSPGGDRVVDNGWVWSPVGVVASWSLRRWLTDNPWESEDGPSRRTLCYRDYFWGGPLCWIDDRTAAVWGYGNDDENLIPAALLFDVETGRRLRWFAGPVGSFAFDRCLFSYSSEAGTSAWDLATGERLLHDASFRPTAYHTGAGRFVTLSGDGRLRLSRLVGER